ncbi:MAG: hypothetical protein IT372_32335, partial [Polyangiaceae bacterium]|nr:hypothetical protein [Polyangiaceae bacterium]
MSVEPPLAAPRPARPPWDFGYAPVPAALADDDGAPLDVVIALRAAVPPARIAAALEPLSPGVAVEPLIERAPIFWYRARAGGGALRAEAEAALAAAAIPVRSVASSRRRSLALGQPLESADRGLGRRAR